MMTSCEWRYSHTDYTTQWNLQVTDTLGLSIIERLSSFGGKTLVHRKGVLDTVGSTVVGRQSATAKDHYQPLVTGPRDQNLLPLH